MAIWPYLELVPHYDFATFALEFPAGPDAIVIPYFSDHASHAIVAWLREHAGEGVRVLSVCEGARTTAAAGLLRGRTATTHFAAREEIARQYPDTRWIANVRIARDGNVLSTAGVTAAYDGSLALLADLRGSAAAQQAAARLGLLPPGTAAYKSPDLNMSDKLTFAWRASDTQQRDLAVRLEPGVDEIQLAAALDVLNRSLAFRAITVAPERRIVRSRYGADLLPREIPEEFTAAETLWLTRDDRTDVDSLAAYDRALDQVAESAGAQVARFVAGLIEYEYEPLSGRIARTGQNRTERTITID